MHSSNLKLPWRHINHKNNVKINQPKHNKGPRLIGLTGSIGSGKTTASAIFSSLGIPTFNSDEEAKNLMSHYQPLKNEIIKSFGSESYSQDGKLNRAYLASQVFNNSHKLEQLNRLVHPEVATHFKNWIAKKSTSPYVLKEAAILFESNAYKGLDKIICVIAPKSIRMSRVMQRDNAELADVIARESNQWTASKKARNAHFIINNDGEHSLIQQVLNIDFMFRNDLFP